MLLANSKPTVSPPYPPILGDLLMGPLRRAKLDSPAVSTFKGGSKTYNSSNQNTAWSFDGNGNPTTYASHTLTFDAENRMTAYGSIMTAGYRADGLRAWKTTSAGTTYYLYDGENPVEEVDGSGNKTAVMTFGPNGVLARTTSSRTLLYELDALGQMTQQIDASSGNIIASYLFDAWGARQVSTSDPTAASDPYSGYNTSAGYLTDWETGLQLLGHRYYDPSAGRFLNRDPIGFAGGVNVYAYVGNSSTARTDSNGFGRLWPETENPENPGLMGCLQGGAFAALVALFKSLSSVGSGNGLSPQAWCSICSALAACALGAIIWSVIFSNPVFIYSAALGLACLAGLITSIASKIAQKLCELFICHKPSSIFCDALEAGVAGIAGCFGGIASFIGFKNSDVTAWIIRLMGWGLGGAGAGISFGCQGTNPIAQPKAQ